MFLVAVPPRLALPLKLAKEISEICGLVYSVTWEIFKFCLCEADAADVVAPLVDLQGICARQRFAPEQEAALWARSQNLFCWWLCRPHLTDGWLLGADALRQKRRIRDGDDEEWIGQEGLNSAFLSLGLIAAVLPGLGFGR
jgi:hypothetical protein